MALSEFEKLQSKEVARFLIEEMKVQFVTKKQLYLWTLGLVVGVLIFIIKNPHVMKIFNV